jgi:phenylacetate-CoA ligase
LTKIRGVLFSPTSVEEIVRGFPELGDEYQVVLHKKGELDEVTVKAEIKPGGE